MSFQMMPILTDEELDRIDGTALDILEEIGLGIPVAAVREILASKTGVTVDGEIARFDRALVLDLVRDVKGCADYDSHVMAGAYSHNYLDPDTDEVVPPTTEHLIKSIKQADALGMGVCAPVVPLNVPGPRQEIVMERLTHEYARNSYGAGQATHVVTAEAMLEMSSLVGRPHGLELWVTSPLKLDGKGLDIIWQLRHRKPNIRVSTMPVRGMSASINLGELLAQSVAECFGAAVTLKLLELATEVSYRIDSFVTYGIDMQSANVLLSGPDYLRLLLISTQIAKRHGVSTPAAKVLLTHAKKPGTQAAAEKAAACIAAAMAGADTFLAAGTLSDVSVFSPIQMLVDREIMSFVDAFMRPLDSLESINLGTMMDAGIGGLFLDHDSTLRNWRDIYWKPALFSFNPFTSWLQEGSLSAEDRARDLLASLPISEEPVVSREIQKELRAIEDRYAAML